MNPGDIYLFKNYRFRDGEFADKYLVILTQPANQSDYILFCKTTSQQGTNPATRGCIYGQGLFFIPSGAEWFPRDTWVPFYDGLEALIGKEFNDAITHGQAILKGAITQQTFSSLINCIDKSDFVDEEDKDQLPTRRNRRKNKP